MKNIIIGLSITLVSCSNSEWTGEDKVLHAKYGTVIGVGTVTMLNFVEYDGNRPLTASLICSGVGIGKEIYDEYDYGGFDIKDATVTAAACFISSYITHEVLNFTVVPVDDGVYLGVSGSFQ